MAAQRAEMEAKMGRPPPGASAAVYRKIPAKYANPKLSPLNVTIESGRQVKEFNLSD